MTMPPVTVRRLLPDEAAAFRDIRLEGLRRDPDAFSSTLDSEGAEPPAFFADRLTNAAVFAAFRGGELLGVAGFLVQRGPKHAHKGLLWGMYVRPAARGMGVGRRLVEAVIAHARTCVELIQLSVISDNLAARRLYARLGFTEYGVEKRAAKYRGRYHDDVLMVKMLAPEPPSGDNRR